MNQSQYALICLQRAIRSFFSERNFLDVLVPPAVQNPGMEPHIHPFQLFSKKSSKAINLYLHTSPEFTLKKLISEGSGDLFSLNYCFRDEPSSSYHRCQFIMLEWYRINQYYNVIQSDVIELIEFCKKQLINNKINILDEKPLATTTITVEEAFQKWTNISILENLSNESLSIQIKHNYPNLLPAENLLWEDLFFMLFLNKIEPELKKLPLVILKEYPASMAALSTIKKDNPLVCERFEVYLNGIELANCFYELQDIHEQKKRFKIQQKQKQDLYHYDLPPPIDLYNALEKGLPPCSGIALGVERLLQGLTGMENPFFE